jgi:hypothetical protein
MDIRSTFQAAIVAALTAVVVAVSDEEETGPPFSFGAVRCSGKGH